MNWSKSTEILEKTSDFLTPEDVAKAPTTNTIEANVRYFEAMNARYQNHPYFTAQLAVRMEVLGATAIVAKFLRQTKVSLGRLGIKDEILDASVEKYTDEAHTRSQAQYLESLALPFFHRWEQSREHKFPLNHSPTGHEQVKETWASLTTENPDRWRQYLYHTAVDTNHVESTFFISDNSIRDIVRRGIDAAYIVPLPTSPLGDPEVIRQIIKVTVSAYDILFEVVRDPQQLNRQKICDAQRRLMDTCRFQDLSDGVYIAPGETRTTTGGTVIIGGPAMIQFCPYPSVNDEVDYICHMTKQYLQTSLQNPFALASWLHYLLVNCHPFDDGNGRTSRLIASIPLVQAGYPPININLAIQYEYYAALTEAHDGNYTSLIRCILDGMRATLESIRTAF